MREHTELGTDHGVDQSQKHPQDHGHAHQRGVLGWLRQTFAHSHDIHQKVDGALETSERGIWALKVSLVGLELTALF